MAFIRMILPAWIAGLYAALLLVLLFFFLNPALHLDLPTLVRFLPLSGLISVPAALLWPLAYRFLRLFARRRLRVRWFSFKYLYGFASADLILVSGIYWFNERALERLIPPAMSARLRIGSAILSLVALVFLVAVAWRRLRRRAGVRAACFLLAGLLPLSLAGIRTGYRPPPPSPYTAELGRPEATAPRLLVLGIGGATLDQVLPLVAQGKLPRFGQLLRRGSHGRLTPFRPCVSPVMWESLFTGKLPFKHRVLDASRYRLPGGVGAIRVAPRGFGFQRFASLWGLERESQHFSESEALSFSRILDRLGHPTREIVTEGNVPNSDLALPDGRLERFLDPDLPMPAGTELLADSLRHAVKLDQSAGAAGLAAWREGSVSGLVVLLPGLDRVSHFFLRYAMPAGFGDVPLEEVEKFGPVLERYYRYLDEWVGKFVMERRSGAGESSAAERDLILVVSPHGIEPVPLVPRLLGWLEGNRFESGYHARAPDGMILAAGPGVRHGTPLGKASILDVAPTLLYRYGLPIGTDMDGHPLTRLFDDSFIAENPILLIPSYEASQVGAAPGS